MDESMRITLEHGAGAKKTRELIESLFLNNFNEIKRAEEDAALIYNDKLAYTTDSFIIDPVFFPGGNIGELAVCGTANDLAVRGAKPTWLSSSYIIGEGYSIADLQILVESMAKTAKEAGIEIVTGDTKVINESAFKGVIINTSGIGVVINPNSIENVEAGDVLIVSGTLGDHSVAILSAREGIYLEEKVESDCAVLYHMLENIIKDSKCKFIRDITRGGLSSILYEINNSTGFGIEINKDDIPVKSSVKEFCEITGMDYMGMANEGKVILAVKKEDISEILEELHKSEYGKNAACIGIVTDKHKQVLVKTRDGDERVVVETTNIPRIC